MDQENGVTTSAPSTAESTDEPKKRTPAVGTIRVDVTTFQRVVKTVLHAVSTDKTRAHLSSVHIVSSSDRLIIEGTDGCCMAIWETQGEYTSFDTLIPRDRAEAFLRSLPKPKKQLSIFDDETVRIKGSLESKGVRIQYPVPDVMFPDLAPRLPQHRQGLLAPPFAMHPIYLERAAKIFATATTEGCYPLIEPGASPDEAIRFSSVEAAGLVFVVMPCRIGDEEDEEDAEGKPTGVTQAVADFAEASTKHGTTVTISASSNGKSTRSVTITPETAKVMKEAAKRLRGTKASK